MQYVETFFEADVLARELGQAVLGIRDAENLGQRIREAIEDLRTALDALPRTPPTLLEENWGEAIKDEQFGGPGQEGSDGFGP